VLCAVIFEFLNAYKSKPKEMQMYLNIRVQGSQKTKINKETTNITFNKFTISGLWKALATFSCKTS